MSMSINTRMTPLRWNEKELKEFDEKFEKMQKIHQYSTPLDTTDSKEMATLRKKLIKGIEKNQSNVDELIEQYEVLKEKEFIETHGMTPKEYEEKLEQEQYIRETVTERVCYCDKCDQEFTSTRLHATCAHCGYEHYGAIEKKENASIIGKQIKEVYKGAYETILTFTDGTTTTFTDYSEDQ